MHHINASETFFALIQSIVKCTVLTLGGAKDSTRFTAVQVEFDLQES